MNNGLLMRSHIQLEGLLSRAHTSPPTLTFDLTFQNLITSSPVAKSTTDEVW